MYNPLSWVEQRTLVPLRYKVVYPPFLVSWSIFSLFRPLSIVSLRKCAPLHNKKETTTCASQDNNNTSQSVYCNHRDATRAHCRWWWFDPVACSSGPETRAKGACQISIGIIRSPPLLFILITPRCCSCRYCLMGCGRPYWQLIFI